MLNKFNSLLEGFKDLSHIHSNDQLEKYGILLNNFKPFLAEIKEEKRNNAQFYNIFSVLKIEFYEAKVHTPFLANFLDIDGSHCQGDLFYKSFIRTVVPISKADLFLSFDDEYISCITEQRFNESQPDIYIEHDHPNIERRFGIIIENKIYASDQPQQIERYYKLLKSHNYSDEQLLILYLKPNISEPSIDSLSLELKEQLATNNSFVCIDYVNDIKNWLLETKKEIKATRLTNIIEHYLETLKKFEI